jgi:hypothetical protein
VVNYARLPLRGVFVILFKANRVWRNRTYAANVFLCLFALLNFGCRAHHDLGPGYREVRSDDGINLFSLSRVQDDKFPAGHYEGFEIGLYADGGHTIIPIPLTSTTVDDGLIQTRDFGVLKQVQDGPSTRFFATESQIQKLRALQASGR